MATTTAILGLKNHTRIRLNESLLVLFSNKDLQEGIPVSVFKAIMNTKGEFKQQAKSQWGAMFAPLLDACPGSQGKDLVDAAKLVDEVR